MKVVLIYATKHNHTKKVVEAVRQIIDIKVHNVSDINPQLLEDYDLIVIFCPTYGDEELPLNMEDFLQNITTKNKSFVICELGNYYGYDNYEFGALKIIKNHLLGLDWKEAMVGLSLDSLPKIDWDALYPWAQKLKEYIYGYRFKVCHSD